MHHLFVRDPREYLAISRSRLAREGNEPLYRWWIRGVLFTASR
jgi:hypothetical protein